MHHATVQRLLRRAARVRPGRRPGPLAAWARWRLARAGDRGDTATIDATWETWSDRPDEGLWELLARWQRPSCGLDRRVRLASLVMLRQPVCLGDDAARTAFVELATRSHPVGEVARTRLVEDRDRDLVERACAAAVAVPDGALARFCAEHHLVPARPASRALFLLLTRQHDRYRAFDADGSLLASAYAEIDPRIRAAVRRELVSAGIHDRVRIVAGRDGVERLADLGRDEISYILRQLADEREWRHLWRLVLAVPLAAAVEAMALFDDWSPASAPERRLFARLSAPEARALDVDAVNEALRPPPTILLDVAHHTPAQRRGWWIRAAALSPDNSQIAVASDADRPWGSVVEVYATRTGQVTGPGVRVEDDVVALLHLGRTLLVASQGIRQAYSDAPARVRRVDLGEDCELRPCTLRETPTARHALVHHLPIGEPGAGVTVVTTGGPPFSGSETLSWPCVDRTGAAPPGPRLAWRSRQMPWVIEDWTRAHARPARVLRPPGAFPHRRVERDGTFDDIAGRVRDLLGRPLASMTLDDLALVSFAAANMHRPDATLAVGLLRSCLELRFGTEVVLATARTGTVADPYGVSLSRPDEPAGGHG